MTLQPMRYAITLVAWASPIHRARMISFRLGVLPVALILPSFILAPIDAECQCRRGGGYCLNSQPRVLCLEQHHASPDDAICLAR